MTSFLPPADEITLVDFEPSGPLGPVLWVVPDEGQRAVLLAAELSRQVVEDGAVDAEAAIWAATLRGWSRVRDRDGRAIPVHPRNAKAVAHSLGRRGLTRLARAARLIPELRRE